MARQFSLTHSSGSVHPTAYARVERVEIHLAVGSDAAWARVRLAIYHDAAARAAGRTPVMYNEIDALSNAEFAHFIDGTLRGADRSPLVASYDFIKTLPAFAVGTDV
jgi:hypothetical protein